LDTYLDDHPEALREAIPLVRVVDVNDATLEMYEADTREGLLDSLSQLLSEILPEEFRQELLAIWENKTDGIEFEAGAMTLKGNPLQVIVRWRAPVIDGRMDLSRVIVATSDITAWISWAMTYATTYRRFSWVGT
jgi:PAS domain-containing protein